MRLKTALVLAATLGLLGTTTALQVASAADLGVRQRPYTPPPPPPPPVQNWTGFYVGGFFGGAAESQDVTSTDLNGYNGSPPFSYGLHGTATGGGTIGYNWQFPGSPFLVGLEGEVGYLRMTGSSPDPLSPGLDTVSSARIGDWYAVATGRLGWLFTPDWLVYVKGGAAWTDLHSSVVDSCTVFPCGPDTVNANGSKTPTGWTAGGGFEWMFLPQWSVKAEYLFLGIDENVQACGPDGLGAGTFCFNHKFEGVHTAKLGVNYHF